MFAHEKATQLQSAQFPMESTPPHVTCHKPQILPEARISNDSPSTSEEEGLFLQLADDQQKLLLSENSDTDQSQSNEIEENEETLKVIKKNSSRAQLKNQPTFLQCQFCKKYVTTKIKMSKLKNEITIEQKHKFKLQKRTLTIMCFFPIFWHIVPCIFAALKHIENTAIAYHQCPSCSSWIGVSTLRSPSLYCTVAGTKEEQFEELRQKFFGEMARTQKNLINL